jgi:hypothetical protein
MESTVEAVLPGVQQRFTQLHNEIVQVKETVDAQVAAALTKEDLEDVMENHSSSQIEAVRSQLAQSFGDMAVRIAGSDPKEKAPSNRRGDAGLARPVHQAPAADDEELQRVIHWPLLCRMTPRSATHIYNEFYGLGECAGRPIDGGIAALETQYRTKWRAGDPAYQQCFSRMRRVVCAVDDAIKLEGGDTNLVLGWMDKAFVEGECGSLGGFIKVLQQQGWITSKARGGNMV